MKNTTKIIVGVILIALGVVFGLNALGVAEIDIFFDGWWTLFIIIPCAVGLFTEHEKLGNIIGIVVGVLLFLGAQDIIDFSLLWKLLVPVIIVAVGVKMLFGSFVNSKNQKAIETLKNENQNPKNAAAMFSGVDIDCDNEIFEGAQLNAVFGGVKCDLRKAFIQKDCVITASAIFGGIDILLPDNVNVKISSNSLFGGVSDKRHKNHKDNAVTVYVNATCMFGGVDVK